MQTQLEAEVQAGPTLALDRPNRALVSALESLVGRSEQTPLVPDRRSLFWSDITSVLREYVGCVRGEAYIIRYADDFICAFELESDARRFQEVLPKRLARFSLELAEEKAQLLRFGRFARRDCPRPGEGAPGTFDFLGFTPYCGRSRAKRFKLKRKTAKKKFQAKVRDLKNWFHQHLATPLSEEWASLNAKLRGRYQYYGINDNWPWLLKYRGQAKRLAYRWLNRRSQSKSKSWKLFYAYMDRFPLASSKRLADLIEMTRAR